MSLLKKKTSTVQLALALVSDWTPARITTYKQYTSRMKGLWEQRDLGSISIPRPVLCCLNWYHYHYFFKKSSFTLATWSLLSHINYTVEPLLKDSPEHNTKTSLLRQVLQSQRYRANTFLPLKEENPLYNSKNDPEMAGPKVSTIKRFHCMPALCDSV